MKIIKKEEKSSNKKNKDNKDNSIKIISNPFENINGNKNPKKIKIYKTIYLSIIIIHKIVGDLIF